MNSGEWAGVMMSADRGDTWKMLKGFPVNYYVTGILEGSPSEILISAQVHTLNTTY